MTRNSEDTVPPRRPLREHRGTEDTSELEESLGTGARKQQERLMRQLMIPIERDCGSRLERGLGQVMGKKPPRILIEILRMPRTKRPASRPHRRTAISGGGWPSGTATHSSGVPTGGCDWRNERG